MSSTAASSALGAASATTTALATGLSVLLPILGVPEVGPILAAVAAAAEYGPAVIAAIEADIALMTAGSITPADLLARLQASQAGWSAQAAPWEPLAPAAGPDASAT